MLKLGRIRSNNVRKEIVISCWHENEFESAAMWKLYSKNGKGIAIQSNFKKFKESFDICNPCIHIGKVSYVNHFDGYSKRNLNNDYSPFLYKEYSFKHEEEIRAIVSLKDTTKEENSNGMYVDVNLDKLIENIYVSPKSSKNFLELVNLFLSKYGLRNKDVKQSNLYKRPFIEPFLT
jgi:hypothetical protein